MKFRIVTDKYNGYEAQVWQGWWIFAKWHEISGGMPGRLGTNTSKTVEQATDLIYNWMKPAPSSQQPTVVKELEI